MPVGEVSLTSSGLTSDKGKKGMTRAQLIAIVAEQTQTSAKTCDLIIRKFLDTITLEVAAGEKITVSGFGTFERKRRKATMARNPQTGEPMEIESQNVAVFRAGSGLKEAVRANDERRKNDFSLDDLGKKH